MGLHEDPHAATQVPAQLVGLAAACERRWRFDWRGPDGGLTGVLGKGLAVAPAVIPGKALAGGLVVLLGWDPAKDHHLLKCVSDLECLHKDLHATTEMSPESLPHGGSGLKGDSLRRCGASCHGKGLAGFAKTASRQGSCRGSPLRPLCSSWSRSWRCFSFS